MANDEPPGLMIELKRRDRDAWSAAFDRHRDEIYGFVFHLVGGNRAVAEELNQEVWLEAMDGIDHCDAVRGSFRNWLFGIARRRVALHYRRRAANGKPTSLSSPYGQDTEIGDNSILPEDVLEQVERHSIVRAAMLLLPIERREVLLCKYVEGLSVQSISIHMGKTAKAVESLLSRSREQLRELLHEYKIPSGDDQTASKELSNE